MKTSPPDRHQTDATHFGATLRSARTASGISLAELHARTKISTDHLVALEEGRFSALPPLAFTRGFLRTVAGELGVDPEPLLRILNAAMADEGTERSASWRRLGSPIVTATATSPLRRRIISLGLLVLLAALAVVVLLTRQLREFAQPVLPVEPPVNAATPAAAIPSAVASPTAVQPGTPTHQVIVEVHASGRSWLLVQTATGPLFEGFISSGQSMRWQSQAPISLRAGNAGAITVIVNGYVLGTYGRPGEVVDRTFQPGAPP